MFVQKRTAFIRQIVLATCLGVMLIVGVMRVADAQNADNDASSQVTVTATVPQS